MRVASWSLASMSGLLLAGCNLNIAFDSNRGDLVAQRELVDLMSDVSRTSISSESGTLSGLREVALPFALANTRLSCTPDSTGNSRRNALGVPVDLTYAWTSARCATNVRSVEQTFVGATRIEDLGGRYAVRVTHDNLVGTVSSPGSRKRYSLSGVVEILAPDATTATIVQKVTSKTETLSMTESGIETRIRDLTFSLVDTLGVPRSGTRTWRGPNLFSIKGTYVAVTETFVRDSTHLQITTVAPLHADATCPTGYRAGEIRAVVSGVVKDVVTMRYNCQ
jgi:hypothetical protein